MRTRLAPWVALATLTAAGAAAAAGYALTAPKRYRATAQLIVSPVSPSDPTFAGIGVLRDTGGKRTAAASVAALVRSPQIVDAAAASLAIRRSRSSLLHALDSHVVDTSDVVAVTAEDSSAGSAAQLANTFANALVSQRTATFQSDLAAAIQRDTKLLAQMSKAQRASPQGAAISRRLTTLTGLQGRPDPTVAVASQAAAPASASWPDDGQVIGLGAAIGAGLGILAAAALLLVRRQRLSRAPVYDPAVSERALERMMERLEGRLAARESALAARERDVQASLAELRDATKKAPELEQREGDLARRLEELEERVAAVTKRELELARRAAEISAAERSTSERAAELAQAERDAERAAAEREAALAEAEREAAEREAELAARPAAAPPPVRVAALAGDGKAGRYNLVALERAVEEHGPEFPNRLEEWSSYLFFLREYADPDGTVPASFDWLIEETFAELQARI
jgi:capsular polysaccharide biosynthesis protein